MEKPRRRRVIGKLTILGLLVLIPLSFLYFFSKGEQKFTPPQYYGPKIPIVKDGKETGDTTYYKVPNFEMLSLDNKKFNLDKYKNKIIVAIVTGTTCPSDCEIQPESLSKILNKEIYHNDSYDDVIILSEFIDYDVDRVPLASELNAYYKNGFDPKQWIFFTTPRNKLFDFKPHDDSDNLLESSYPGARNGYAYYNFGVLIDKDRYVRGVYYLNDSRQIRRLLDGIKLLKKAEDYEKN